VQRVAVVDIGSNSVRLLLCTGVDEHGPVGERETEVVGLKRGAATDGTLAEDALERLDARLRDVGQKVAAAGGFSVIAVGTSAVRDAPNRARVAEILARHLSCRLTVLTGQQEAGLAYSGARLAVADGVRVAVLDVGGASTEVAVGSAGPPTAVSVDLGAVRCTKGAISTDPPDPEALGALRETATRRFSSELEGLPGHDVAIGVAGTLTSLAAVDLGEYDPAQVHGHRLGRTRLQELIGALGRLPLAERRDVPGLHPDRAPVVVTGGVIALAALAALGHEEITISERDLLDGAVLSVVSGALRADPPIS
jgi:exopolyphosphatase/guanosine-5'-triphosphate,3'-diphosphate pyrophosphatase